MSMVILWPLIKDLEDNIKNPIILLKVWFRNGFLIVLDVRLNIFLHQVRTDLVNEDDLNVPHDYVFECNNSKVDHSITLI